MPVHAPNAGGCLPTRSHVHFYSSGKHATQQQSTVEAALLAPTPLTPARPATLRAAPPRSARKLRPSHTVGAMGRWGSDPVNPEAVAAERLSALLESLVNLLGGEWVESRDGSRDLKGLRGWSPPESIIPPALLGMLGLGPWSGCAFVGTAHLLQLKLLEAGDSRARHFWPPWCGYSIPCSGPSSPHEAPNIHQPPNCPPVPRCLQ